MIHKKGSFSVDMDYLISRQNLILVLYIDLKEAIKTSVAIQPTVVTTVKQRYFSILSYGQS